MENNFEKYISDSMNNPPEIPFEDRLWKDMESKLDATAEQPKRGAFASVLPLALFSIIPFALAGFFNLKHGEALEKIDRLEKLIIEQQNNTRTSQAVEKETITVYDTVYNKVIINEIASAKKPAINNSTNSAPFFTSVKNYSAPTNFDQLSGFSFFENSKYTTGFAFAKKHNSDKNIESENLLTSQIENDLTDISYLPLTTNFLKTDVTSLNVPAVISKKRKRNKSAKYYLLKAQPTRFAVSAGIGNTYDLNLKENQFGLTRSLQAEFGYGNHLGLILGANYLTSKFEIEGQEDQTLEEIMEYFPKLSNDTNNDLEEIYGYFNYVQIPFGLKYEFLSNRSLRPSISGGLVSRMATRSSLRYEYDGTNSESAENLLEGGFQLSSYWSSVGVRYLLNNNWSLNLETRAQFDLNPGQYKYENLQLLQWNAGIQYRLK